MNTTEVKQFVRANGIVTLKADKTQPAPEVDELLALLGNKGKSIPFYAVFPAANPNGPIVLGGVFTSSKPILDALKKAGPSMFSQKRRETDARRKIKVGDSGPPQRSLSFES